MDAILPTPTFPPDSASGASPATPFDLETITLTRREHVALKNGVASYKSLHTRAAQRIEHLKLRHKKEITALQIKRNTRILRSRRYQAPHNCLENYIWL
jgi:hypothetical protein